GRLEEEVAEVAVEGVPLVVDDPEHAVLDTEGVVVVHPGAEAGELGHPAAQVLAVEERNPLLLVRVLGEGGARHDEQHGEASERSLHRRQAYSAPTGTSSS